MSTDVLFFWEVEAAWEWCEVGFMRGLWLSLLLDRFSLIILFDIFYEIMKVLYRTMMAYSAVAISMLPSKRFTMSTLLKKLLVTAYSL